MLRHRAGRERRWQLRVPVTASRKLQAGRPGPGRPAAARSVPAGPEAAVPGLADTEAVWREFRARLLAFVGRRVSDPHAAEDIVQEVLLRMHRQVSSLEHPAALSAWIYQIARNAVIDHFRSAATRRELPAGSAVGEDLALPPEPETSELRSELAGCLAPLLARLAAADREALMLTDFEGLTQAAAAARLGLSASGMKSRVQRARARLRKQLTDCCQIYQDPRGSIIGYHPHSGSCDCHQDV